MMFNEYDVVRLRVPLPAHGLAAGTIGAVVMVYETPPGYEVEFVDEAGDTLALVTLSGEELELAQADSGPPER